MWCGPLCQTCFGCDGIGDQGVGASVTRTVIIQLVVDGEVEVFETSVKYRELVGSLDIEQRIYRLAGEQAERHITPYFNHFRIKQTAPETGFADQMVALVRIHVDCRNLIDGDIGRIDSPEKVEP